MELPTYPDDALRTAARGIYNSCYPSDEWTPVGFEEAERYESVHYRQAVDAARIACAILRRIEGGEFMPPL